MATTITIRKIPKALYNRLVSAADRHRRTLEDEAMACLEAGKPAAQAIAQRSVGN